MSKEIKEIYKCDCCKREDTSESFISWKMIDKYNSSKKFEICQECAKTIVEGYKAINIELGCSPYSDWIFKIAGEEEYGI